MVNVVLMSVHLLSELGMLLHLPRHAIQIKCCDKAMDRKTYDCSTALRCCERSGNDSQSLSYPKAQVAQSVSSKQSSLNASCNPYVQRFFSWRPVQSMFPSGGMSGSIGQTGF